MADSIVEAILSSLGASGPEAADRLTLALRDARSRWPGVEVTAGAMVAQLKSATQAPSDSPATWQELSWPDLWLAAGCAMRVPQALAAFAAAYRQDLQVAHRRMGARAPAFDDFYQTLTEKLFAGPTPRIATYSGRGDLRGWLRVAAVRTLLDMTRARTNAERPAEDGDVALELSVPADDPELQYLKEKYRHEFRRAFEDAAGAIGPESRNLLRFHYTYGMSIDEISASKGVHRATAARQLNRARESLLEETRRILGDRLAVSPTELASIMRLIESQLHVTVDRILRTPDSEPGD